MHQPSCDCHCAYSEDCELEHQGEPMIWFQPVDGDKQYRSDAQDQDAGKRELAFGALSRSASVGHRHFIRCNRRFA